MVVRIVKQDNTQNRDKKQIAYPRTALLVSILPLSQHLIQLTGVLSALQELIHSLPLEQSKYHAWISHVPQGINLTNLEQNLVLMDALNAVQVNGHLKVRTWNVLNKSVRQDINQQKQMQYQNLMGVFHVVQVINHQMKNIKYLVNNKSAQLDNNQLKTMLLQNLMDVFHVIQVHSQLKVRIHHV